MSAMQKRLLTASQVVKHCAVGEIAPQGEGGDSIDPKLFLGLDQERFEHALALCVETDDPLHNMQAVNLAGSAGLRIVEGLLKKILDGRNLPDPEDICYVHNFDDPHRPLPLKFSKGKGEKFKRRLARVLMDLRNLVPKELLSDQAVQRLMEVRADYDAWVKERIQKFARSHGFEASGDPEKDLTFTPHMSLVREVQGESPSTAEEASRPSSPQDRDQLTPPQQESLDRRGVAFYGAFQRWLREENESVEVRTRTRDVMLKVDSLQRSIAKDAIDQVFNKWWPAGDAGGTASFREKLLEYAIYSYRIFLKDESEKKQTPWEMAENHFLPWHVKVLVDHSDTKGVPIIAAPITELKRAIGTISRGRNLGFSYAVDHTNLVPGLFHLAIGGYLVVNLREMAMVPGVWHALKDVIKTGELSVGQVPFMPGYEVLNPVPVSGRMRVIAFGPAWLMHLLAHVDDEFARLFKIRGELLTKVERTPEQLRAYRSWLKELSKEEGLHPLSDDAVCALVEHSQRLAGDQQHLSTDLETLATILQEANTLAKGKKSIKRSEITEVIKRRVWRSNVPHERRLEHIKSGSLLVSTEGEAIGQINGLVVSSYDSVEQEIEAFCRSKDLPFVVPAELVSNVQQQYGGFYGDLRAELAFGFATRITASATVGKFTIVNIHKEVKLAGPSFEKADLIVQGLLRKLYAVNEPLEAHLTYAFEQTYGGVDGDSASLAKFYALTSAISGLPIRQDVAITGSLNLHGEVQPIGGANEKIEGFFDICKARGELKSHGVIVPHQNEQNLMLREDVVQAITDKKFNVWSIKELDEGIEILFGKPPAEFHEAVRKGFARLAHKAKKFYSAKEKRE